MLDSDLRELYQEVIVDHSKRPRNFGTLADANRRADGDNPLCGDQVTVYLRFEDGAVADVKFEGKGCAISLASASLMTEMIKGRTEAEVRRLFDAFHRLVTEDGAAAEIDELDKLIAFAGVRDFPIRVKCATLPWHTFTAALESTPDVVSTE